MTKLTKEDIDAAETHGLTEWEARVTKQLHNVLHTAMEGGVKITFLIGMLRAHSNELARSANQVAAAEGMDLEQWSSLPLEQADVLREGVLDENDYTRVAVIDDSLGTTSETEHECEDVTPNYGALNNE